MIEQLCQHVSKSTRRRLRGGKKQHAHEIGDVDVSKGNSVFVEVEQKSDEIVSLYGIGPALLHNGQNMLEEMLPRLHRLLLRDRGLCGIRLRASEDLASPTGEQIGRASCRERVCQYV